MRNTRVLPVISEEEYRQSCELAGELLREGGLVAVPTETVYGLAANGLDERAVASIFTAKGRPSDNPLILHVAEKSDVSLYVKEIPSKARLLMDAFFPGALTLIFKALPIVPLVTTGGLPTVAIRMPSLELTRDIISVAGCPLAAPSANRSGKPSPTDAAAVLEDMQGRIDAVIDGGSSSIGLESTVLDVTVDPPVLLRPGAVTASMIAAVIGDIVLSNGQIADGEAPASPGMKYTHYAPNAPVHLITGAPEATASYIAARQDASTSGVLCFDECRALFSSCLHVISFGAVTDSVAQAGRLFSALRAFDATAVERIYVQCPLEQELGIATCNRLRKAAGVIVSV